jgi:curved DNA-binding protein CbpA
MIQHEKTNRAFELAKKENLYERLGVSSNATSEEITKAYRQLAILLHPDRNQNRQDEARKAFARINEANEILRDPDRRKEYDSSRTRSAQSHESWSQGAKVDPHHRERYSSNQEPGRHSNLDTIIERMTRDLNLRILEILSVEPSKEGVLRWLSNPPGRRVSTRDFNNVLQVAVELKLIDRNDVQRTPAIMSNLKEALVMRTGDKGSAALALETTLKQTGIWDDQVFNTNEINAKRQQHAEHLLTRLMRIILGTATR